MGAERGAGDGPGSSRSQHLSSPRFDLMGLSPDAPEDEAGIKKAAENSKAPAPQYPPSVPAPQESTGQYLAPFPGPSSSFSPTQSCPSPQSRP